MASGTLSKTREEIQRVDSFIKEIFQGLNMEAGSICRIASRYLENWGIIVQQDDLPEIERMSRKSGIEDWKGGDHRIHNAIEIAIVTSGLQHGNKAMNAALAGMAVPVMGSMISSLPEGGMLNILDVGAGSGDTTAAILDQISSSSDTEHIAKKCHFYLLEPSYRKVSEIGAMLENNGLNPRHTIAVSTLEEHLKGIKDGYFHVIVSSAVFHHMSTPSYLHLIRSKMTEDGVFLVGDWYLPTWSRPAFLIPILKNLGADNTAVARYCNYFRINSGKEIAYWEQMHREQKTAHEQMVEYIKCLSVELASVSSPKIKIFEAHQSLAGHHEDVKKAGFCLDISELKEKHAAFVKIQNNIRRMYDNNEIACVWAAAKLSQKRNC